MKLHRIAFLAAARGAAGARTTSPPGTKRLLLLSSVVGLALASGASGAAAVPVSGTYTAGANLGTTICLPVGKSTFLFNCTTTGFVSTFSGGDLTGSSLTNFTSLINCISGREEGHGIETFTGSVAGMGSGTVTWTDHFYASIDCNTFTLSGFTDTGTIKSGTGTLAGLQGTLRFTLTTYEGFLSE